VIAPFSFFANAASTLQECTLTYHRPMPKKDNLSMGRQKCHPFALPEKKTNHQDKERSMTRGQCKRKRPGLIRVTGRFRTALPRKLFASSLDAPLKA
jgi:hypothetical protein